MNPLSLVDPLVLRRTKPLLLGYNFGCFLLQYIERIRDGRSRKELWLAVLYVWTSFVYISFDDLVVSWNFPCVYSTDC